MGRGVLGGHVSFEMRKGLVNFTGIQFKVSIHERSTRHLIFIGKSRLAEGLQSVKQLLVFLFLYSCSYYLYIRATMQKIWRRKKHILTIIDALLLNYHIYCLACNLSSCWVENKCWQKKIITGIAYCTKSVLTNNSGWVRIKDKFESQRVCLSTYCLLNMYLYIYTSQITFCVQCVILSEFMQMQMQTMSSPYLGRPCWSQNSW